MNTQARNRPIRRAVSTALAACCLAWLVAGCQSGSDKPGAGASASAGRGKVKVAYIGLTCEAAMFVAQEKGFFREEGLDVEFVKTDWDGRYVCLDPRQAGLELGDHGAARKVIEVAALFGAAFVLRVLRRELREFGA